MRPVAFRIFDFKSIEDSGICRLSGDGITVLAGQNEAGKTAVLTALRDFDREVGAAPVTQDYEPEERSNTNPRVSAEFESLDIDGILSDLAEEKHSIPPNVVEHLKQNPTIWVTRDLRTGKFSFDDSLTALWSANVTPEQANEPASDAASDASDTATVAESEPEEVADIMSPNEFAGWLRDY